MNEICIVLYVNALYSQHLLNKPLTNRESNKLMLFPSQLFFSIVENLLRVYAVYYQYGGKSSVSCPLKPSDSAPLKHSTMPP